MKTNSKFVANLFKSCGLLVPFVIVSCAENPEKNNGLQDLTLVNGDDETGKKQQEATKTTEQQPIKEEIEDKKQEEVIEEKKEDDKIQKENEVDEIPEVEVEVGEGETKTNQ